MIAYLEVVPALAQHGGAALNVIRCKVTLVDHFVAQFAHAGNAAVVAG